MIQVEPHSNPSLVTLVTRGKFIINSEVMMTSSTYHESPNTSGDIVGVMVGDVGEEVWLDVNEQEYPHQSLSQQLLV